MFFQHAVLEPRGVPVAEAAGKPKFDMAELKKKAELELEEAAFYCGVSRRTFYNWGQPGKRARPRGRKDHRGRLMFLRTELDRFMKDNSEAA